jgi:tRNA modification GTPase
MISKIFPALVELSAKRSRNIELLEDAVACQVYKGAVHSPEPVMVSSLRHINSLRAAEKLIAEAGNSLDNNLSAEFIAQGIKDALVYLDNILGKDYPEDLLDKIFSRFCIGK